MGRKERKKCEEMGENVREKTETKGRKKTSAGGMG